MLVTTFTLQLGVPVQPRLVTVGRYDGRHPCLTCGTSGGMRLRARASVRGGTMRSPCTGRVFVHNPHGDRTQNGVTFLKINKNVGLIKLARVLRVC